MRQEEEIIKEPAVCQECSQVIWEGVNPTMIGF